MAGRNPLLLLGCCFAGKGGTKPFDMEVRFRATLYSPPLAHHVILFLALTLSQKPQSDKGNTGK